MATIVTPEDSYLSPTSPDAPGPLPTAADEATKLYSSDELSSKDTESGSGRDNGVNVTNLDKESKPEVNGEVSVIEASGISQQTIRSSSTVASVGEITAKLEAVVVVDEDDVPANCDLVEENLYLGECLIILCKSHFSMWCVLYIISEMHANIWTYSRLVYCTGKLIRIWIGLPKYGMFSKNPVGLETD